MVLEYGGGDAFVTKVNAYGTDLIYCGYIGGEDFDQGHDIAVDTWGNAYVTGTTGSNEESFPVKIGPDLTYNGGHWPFAMDGYVAKVNADGSDLIYCGYIGGADTDDSYGITVDAMGNAYVTGSTESSENDGFPVTVGPDLTFNSKWANDAYVARVNKDGSAFDYCGYIGGVDAERGMSIAMDTLGNVYVTGVTDSTEELNFPVTIGPDLTQNGEGDAFVAKVPSYHVLLRRGNVNTGEDDTADVFFINGSAGDGERVLSIPSGTQVTSMMEPPPKGPSLADFALYLLQYEPDPAGIAEQPYNIGTSCMPMPLSNGNPKPPPFTLVNNIGYFIVLGKPLLPGVPAAPCTIFNVPGLPMGTYTMQGYIVDNGSSGPGVSLTNAIVLKVQ